MKINYMKYNASGNISALVLDKVEQSNYKEINDYILELDNTIEQVGFILSDKEPYTLEMAGLELCVNATRSFALYLSKQHHINHVMINTSGYKQPIPLDINEDDVTIKLDIPIDMQWLTFKGNSYPIIHLEGISHVLIDNDNIFDTKTLHELIDVIDHPKSLLDISDNDDSIFISTIKDIPAIGFMFCNYNLNTMSPIVYVRETNTLIPEGSCGSGSIAYAYFLNKLSNKESFKIKQPGGYLEVSIKDNAYYLSGDIKLEQIVFHKEKML